MRSNLAYIGPEAGFARGASLTAERAPERSGVGGQVQRASELPSTTHSRPCRPSGARFAVLGTSPRAACWVYRYYPPLYPPSPHTPPVLPTCRHYRPRPARCTNSCFGTLVGEPRGSRTHPGLGSLAGLYPLLRFTRPYDWVYD